MRATARQLSSVYPEPVAIQDHFTDEERERQAGLTRSWDGAKRDLANPEIRARIDAQLAKLESSPPAPPMTGEEFLAWVEVERNSSRAG